MKTGDGQATAFWFVWYSTEDKTPSPICVEAVNSSNDSIKSGISVLCNDFSDTVAYSSDTKCQTVSIQPEMLVYCFCSSFLRRPNGLCVGVL